MTLDAVSIGVVASSILWRGGAAAVRRRTPGHRPMRLCNHALLLLVLTESSRSFALSAETHSLSIAADSEELPTPKGVAIGSPSQEQRAEDRRQRGPDDALRAEGEGCLFSRCWG